MFKQRRSKPKGLDSLNHPESNNLDWCEWPNSRRHVNRDVDSFVPVWEKGQIFFNGGLVPTSNHMDETSQPMKHDLKMQGVDFFMAIQENENNMWATVFFYLQRGTLQKSVWSQMEEWRRRSCHIRLHLEQPPLTLFLQVAKCLISICKPWQVENFPHGPFWAVGSRSYGPTLVHPSVHICSKHSMASLSCRYRHLCSLLRLFCFFLCFTTIIKKTSQFLFPGDTKRRDEKNPSPAAYRFIFFHELKNLELEMGIVIL